MMRASVVLLLVGLAGCRPLPPPDSPYAAREDPETTRTETSEPETTTVPGWMLVALDAERGGAPVPPTAMPETNSPEG